MAEDSGGAYISPRNWCFDCGGPLWDHSGARRADSLLGPVVLCRACATRHPGNTAASEPGPLIGWKHRARMLRAARRKGKK